MPKIPSYDSIVSAMPLATKVGQLFMPAVFINDSEAEIQATEQLIKTHHIGSLCFFHSRASAATNFEGKKKVRYNSESFAVLTNLIKRYQAAATYPLLIAIDAEWGLAMRVENTPQYPYAITLGAIKNNDELLFEVGAAIARDCKLAGIHWNLAPVADINNNPDNPVIGYRSFGASKNLVATKALSFISGTASEGVLTCMKHFPGHGNTDTDSHLDLPVITASKEELMENELFPFVQGIAHGVDAIMSGHLSVPNLTKTDKRPASINKEIITGVLREELGFNGVVISDALNMHAVSKKYPTKGTLEWLAFNAGNDVLCFAEHTAEGITAIIANATEAQINASFKRIWALKEKVFLTEAASDLQSDNNIAVEDTLNPSSSAALNRKIAERSLSLLHGSANAIATFRQTDFCTLTVKRYVESDDDKTILDALDITKTEVKIEKNILLLLTPPKVKPANNFGFLAEEIAFVNDLIATKNVVLYHYGNPFALRLFTIEKTTATVVVYQDFKEFQEVATDHFLGTIKAHGEMPVKL